MSMWKRIAGAAVAAGVLTLAVQANAAQPGVLVSGDNLPANVDPHQIFDVPMQLYSLNTYDNLYRYQGNPPKLEPWLAQSHTVSPDGLTWEFKLRSGAKFDIMKAREGYFRAYDNQMVMPMYAVEAKKPADMKDKWDIYKPLGSVPAAGESLEVLAPPKDGTCAMKV